VLIEANVNGGFVSGRGVTGRNARREGEERMAFGSFGAGDELNGLERFATEVNLRFVRRG
jgi:hypothetical protein